MNEPYKIIWKYKNDNRYTQYHVYIFIGGLHPSLDTILNKIEKLDFFDTIMLLSGDELTKLIKVYGNTWYNYFFMSSHLSHMASQIKGNKSMKERVIEKFGEEWYENNIDSRKQIEKKIIYSYSTLIKDEKIKKLMKKGKDSMVVDDDDTDFRLISRQQNMSTSVNKIDSDDSWQHGGRTKLNTSKSTNVDSDDNNNDNNSNDDNDDNDDNNDDNNDNNDGNDGYDDNNDGNDNNDDADNRTNNEVNDDYGDDITDHRNRIGESEIDDNFDVNDIEKLYKDDDVEPDSNISQTMKLIESALTDATTKKKIRKVVEFDCDKDANIHADKLKNVYNKYYVRLQYIYGDDTIRNVKEKICAALKNNKKFGNNAFVIPSRQYLWCEYTYDKKVEKVMLGQKWTRRGELLEIDVEPDSRFYIYEELKDKMGLLRHSFKRYGNKIRHDDDENNIVLDYEGYITSNEIYMLDVYNELGIGYNPSAEVLKNLQDVYLKLYFFKLRNDDIQNIFGYLNGTNNTEQIKIQTVHDTINNDLIIENEITNTVESARKNNNHLAIFKENYITQSVVHVTARVNGNLAKLDLYRIFNKFVTNFTYPYVQYQTIDGGIVYRCNDSGMQSILKNRDNVDVVHKWFENAPYGITFKIRLDDEQNKSKFMTIGLNESGRIEYKKQWQEIEKATIDNIKNTYIYVKRLLEKINAENPYMHINIPFDEEFKYAFINTIQKFELPEKFMINHNDLSEFSRFFYPYIALVIEPKKRQSKIPGISEKSKFGTYLRYKRVSKYDNHSKFEQRVIFFMRNYEFQDNKLAFELAKQFNVTEEKALGYIYKVRAKYPALKKSRKLLKKLDNIPKYKPPGIGIDIQGKHRDKYKIRISGARNKEQLDRITSFMNILIYLYIETYLYKKEDRQILKEKLSQLTNIARRRLKVDDIVDYEKDVKIVKQMTKVDARRIGFKPEKGHNQWTRSCQNSGDDKKRRPQQYSSMTVEQLLKQKYKYNEKNGNYEKKVTIGKGKNKQDATLRTIKLPEYNDAGDRTGNYIYYACNPDDNGDHAFIGFLTRSSNPFGHCMPCCFKKDPLQSNNKTKVEFFNQCMGKEDAINGDVMVQKAVGDKLYILQDTNKIHDGRFGFLPKYLDKYFNHITGKTKKIRHHYLEESLTGYFFKYGTNQDEYQFINAIGGVLDMTVDQIKDKVIKALTKDKHDQIFTALNNGNLKSQFIGRDKYIDFIKMSGILDREYIGHILCLPSILRENGINIIIFTKKEFKIKKTLEKERIIEDFYIEHIDPENIMAITDPTIETIFLINDRKNYYPIVMVKKSDKISKTIDTGKVFMYSKDDDNIVRHVSDFIIKNNEMIVHQNYASKFPITAKNVEYILRNYGNEYNIKCQIVDAINKCKYIITDNNVVIPVCPSGSLWNVNINKSIDSYIADLSATIDYLMRAYKMSKKQIPVKPIGVYYEVDSDVPIDFENKNTQITVIAILTKTRESVPIKPIRLTLKELDDKKLAYENKPLTDKIDNEIAKGRTNFQIDDRIRNVTMMNYIEEGYELFRLELSNHLTDLNNKQLYAELERILKDKMHKVDKITAIRMFMYALIDDALYKKYVDLVGTPDKTQKVNVKLNKHYLKFVNIIESIPKNVISYQIENERYECKINNKQTCGKSIHCGWDNGKCKLSLTVDLIVMYVNRVSEELAQGGTNAFEIMKIGNYYVSDIVDRTKFTEMEGQRIIKGNSSNIKWVLQDLLGKEIVPIIGRRKRTATVDVDYDKINIDNHPLDLKDKIIQKIIPNNMTIFRAYANGYYWLKNAYFENDSRNLGYYHPVQTNMAIKFRANVINWLTDSGNIHKYKHIINKIDSDKNHSTDEIVRSFIFKLAKETQTFTNGTVEFMILSKLNYIPILLHDTDNKIIGIFDYGDYVDVKRDTDIKQYDPKKSINIKLGYGVYDNIPNLTETIYYKDI